MFLRSLSTEQNSLREEIGETKENMKNKKDRLKKIRIYKAMARAIFTLIKHRINKQDKKEDKKEITKAEISTNSGVRIETVRKNIKEFLLE